MAKRKYVQMERVLIMRDVLFLGGTWTVNEVVERFEIARRTAYEYLHKLSEMYDLEKDDSDRETVWRMVEADPN